MSEAVQITGATVIQPTSRPAPTPAVHQVFSMAEAPAALSGRATIDATDLAPFEVPLQGLAALLVVVHGSRSSAGFVCLLTSSEGVARLPLGEEIVRSTRGAAGSISRVEIVGQGEVEWLVVGQ
jgi:hypothetical protein